MQPCPATLSGLPSDLQARWDQDPAAVVRAILDNEARQGDQYRECAARHASLVEWIVESE